MRRSPSLVHTAGAAFLLAVTSAIAGEDSSLLVMLQASDLVELRKTILDNGGSVTHDLPIIDALGARMSRMQLDRVEAQSASLYRVIDDLAYVPDPEPETSSACGLTAGLELRWNGSTARWTLFNKGKENLTLTRFRLNWPAELESASGKLPTMRIGDTMLVVETPDANLLVATPPEATPVTVRGAASQYLEIEFAQAPANPAAIQNLISLEADAGDACTTKLVASYNEPDADSYFPTVTGAALLHSHGVTGSGITVAMLDSGLWEHPTLARDTAGTNRIDARYDAIDDKAVPEAFDESGHGTHMTSVLARSDQVTRPGAARPSYRGIAPDARLAVVKAFDSSGEAGFLDIVRGIQWVVDNREKYDIRVLNLSFSARPRWPYWQDPVNQALMHVWKAGVFIVAAAGNDGSDAMSIGSPGNLPYLLTVGAITDSWTLDDRDDDYIPDFSSRGPTPLGHIKPDVVAPGGHMAGLVRPGSSLHREYPEYLLANGDFVMTGTSQAAAVVSGIAALLLQLEPELSNDALKCMLTSSAEPAIEEDGRLAYSPFQQGSGLVNVQRALTLGDKDCANVGLDIDADIAGSTHYEGPAQFSDSGPPTLPGEPELVNPRTSEKGMSDTRRWGVVEHLDRLGIPHSDNTPIDWFSILAEEQQRINSLAGDEI